MKRIAVLGSTGSIGVSTLDVVEGLGEPYRIAGLSAHSNWRRLLDQARRHQADWISLADPQAREAARREAPELHVLADDADVCRHVGAPEVDMVVSAIVGAPALPPTLAAVEAGKTIALANKETLVMAGEHVMARAAVTGAVILPVDSEHSAVFQCLQAGRAGELSRVILTASGGALRDLDADQLRDVTVDQALDHPTWDMGPKVTIDSATLMNKALEIVEARWLFDLRSDQIDVVIHPESIVHSLVEFTDGSTIAQLSPPDMRLPIQYALTWPERRPGRTERLDLSRLGTLTFRQPAPHRFPALDLGLRVARDGGTTGAVLNAANEAAVDLFIDGRIRFDQIVPLCEQVLASHTNTHAPTLEAIDRADRWAREEVHACSQASATSS